MPFKKKIYRAIDGAGVPFIQTQVEEKESLVKGNKVVTQITSNVDVSDPINQPSFPDPKTFNDLEAQLRAGVPLTQVNTRVLQHTDVAEFNNEIENVIESDPLNTENNEN